MPTDASRRVASRTAATIDWLDCVASLMVRCHRFEPETAGRWGTCAIAEAVTCRYDGDREPFGARSGVRLWRYPMCSPLVMARVQAELSRRGLLRAGLAAGAAAAVGTLTGRHSA